MLFTYMCYNYTISLTVNMLKCIMPYFLDETYNKKQINPKKQQNKTRRRIQKS